MSKSMEYAEHDVETFLPSVPPTCVGVINTFYQRRAPLTVQAWGRDIQIVSSFEWNRSSHPFCLLEIEIDGNLGVLLVHRPLIDLVFRALDSGIDFSAFQEKEAALLAELALDDILKKIEAGIGGKISVKSLSFDVEAFEELPEPFLTFIASIPEIGPLALHLHIHEDPSLRLSRYFNQSVARPNIAVEPFSILSFPACIRVGALVLTQAELKTLAPGDVVLLDRKKAAPGSLDAALVIGETLAAQVKVVDGVATLIETPCPAIGRSLGRLTIGGIQAEANQANSNLDSEGVSFALTLELARFHISLVDVSAYRGGTVLPFALDGKTVEIVANGKTIGEGEIIAIGNSLGTKITRLFQKTDQQRSQANGAFKK